MVDEIYIDCIWHIRNVQADEKDWELSVNYKIPIENEIIKKLLVKETRVKLIQLPDLLKWVRVLVTEIRSRTTESSPIEEAEFSVKTTQILSRLMWKFTYEKPEEVIGCIGDVVGASNTKLRDFSIKMPIKSLSSASQSAFYRIKGKSIETAYKTFGERAKQLDSYPSEVIPPPKKVSAFIAYRRTHQDIAKQLYEIMGSMGAGTLFDPYIDYHEMELGDWKKQIFLRIDLTHVFVVIVSPDYAEPDTFGLVEYKRAKKKAATNGWNDFFAPVFIGKPKTDPGLELRVYDGFEAKDANEISKENRALQNWLGRVSVAGLEKT